MSGPGHALAGALVAVIAAGSVGEAGVAAPAAGAGQAEIVVRNETFSTLSIAVVDADRRETTIGQAPPEFTNTLYIAADATPLEVRLRARLRGSSEILFESDAIALQQGTRVRWTLPDNVLARVRAGAGARSQG